jgi:hypothetical protein
MMKNYKKLNVGQKSFELCIEMNGLTAKFLIKQVLDPLTPRILESFINCKK